MIVKIGEHVCNVSKVSDNEINCEIELASAGTYKVAVTKKDVGNSNKDVEILIPLVVSNISHTEGCIFFKFFS